MPAAFSYLWTTFLRLHTRRANNGFGPSPIGWVDLEAFVKLTKFELSPWEVEIIEDLDSIYLTEYAKSQERNKPDT